jgi:hypothetical protein
MVMLNRALDSLLDLSFADLRKAVSAIAAAGVNFAHVAIHRVQPIWWPSRITCTFRHEE